MRREAEMPPVRLSSTQELMQQADSGDWVSVAYQLAHEYEASGCDESNLVVRLRKSDARARRMLRKASGAVLARIPYDLCLAYTKTGQLGPDLLVDQPRWLQPRPEKDKCFLVAGDPESHRGRSGEEHAKQGDARGKKLPEGWYSVVQFPLGDFPHLLRKGLLRRKDWRAADLQAPKERYYAMWYVDWDTVKGEVFDSRASAERKFRQFLDVYKALERKMRVSGLLVDARFRELDYFGSREEDVMNHFRQWWQQNQTAAAVARDVGETLLSKAAKAQQWDLVRWLLDTCSREALSLCRQLEVEWHGLWDEDALWRAQLRGEEDLGSLVASFGSTKEEPPALQRPWHRGGAVVVPAGSVLRYPKLDMLREAWALEERARGIAVEALRQVGCREVCLALPSALSREAREAWLKDLDELALDEEDAFGTPLLHRAAVAGQEELVEVLLKAQADPDASDRRGYTVLAAAARAHRWEVCSKLLEHGCCTTGRSGDAAFRAAQHASLAAERSKATEEVAAAKLAAEVLDEIFTRRERPRAKSLSDFFGRQVKGDIVHGIEPRPFKLELGMLKHPAAGPSVWSRGLVVGCGLGGQTSEVDWKEPRLVLFAVLDDEAYEAAAKEEALDVGRNLPLLPEEQLLQSGAVKAVAISVPRRRLAPQRRSRETKPEPAGRAGGSAAHYTTVTEWGRRLCRPSKTEEDSLKEAQVVQPDSLGGHRFAAALPVLAWAPPVGTLCVQSATSCCGVPVGRIDVFVDGIRLGETSSPYAEGDLAELEILVPPRELEISTELSGRPLTKQKALCVPREDVCLSVSVSVFLYVSPIPVEEDSKLEPEMMVFVCGHRKDIPEEAQPFHGVMRWDGGEQRLDAWRPVELGREDCLARLQSMTFHPDLGPGRAWSAQEWEDTSTEDCKACQFQRLLRAPVRVGNIVNL